MPELRDTYHAALQHGHVTPDELVPNDRVEYVLDGRLFRFADAGQSIDAVFAPDDEHSRTVRRVGG
ncbi:hypothetical protein [Halorussus litoreus]|uniref:hypothetical protein n=1 Tax=Halorussus litoreus TaxID=1710536 RepID=UPI000E265A33|nr:hypothetical protein [Halorussus litoreus]